MSCFFSAFFGVYRGRFAPKITVLLSEKNDREKESESSDAGSISSELFL